MPATAPYNSFPQTRLSDGWKHTLNFSVDQSAGTFKAYVYADEFAKTTSKALFNLTEATEITKAGKAITFTLTAANITSIGAGKRQLVIQITPVGGVEDSFLVGELFIGQAASTSKITSSTATTITVDGTEVTVTAQFAALPAQDNNTTFGNVSGSSAVPGPLTANQLQTLLNLATGFYQWRKGADIASAAPLVLGTDGNYFDVTGTTGFAAITVAAGTFFMLQFDGALTLTHHATNLDLPGEANITTAAGDVFIGFATGANTVQCLSYTRADGTAVVAAAAGGFASVRQPTVGGDVQYGIPGTAPDRPTTLALIANTLFYMPFFVDRDCTVDRMRCNVTTAGAGGVLIRMGIYPMSDIMQPGTLTIDAGTVAGDSTGLKEITVSQALTAATAYLLVIWSDGTPTLTAHPYKAPGIPVSWHENTQLIYLFKKSSAFTTLPSSGEAWDTVAKSNAIDGHYGFIQLRLSSVG